MSDILASAVIATGVGGLVALWDGPAWAVAGFALVTYFTVIRW